MVRKDFRDSVIVHKILCFHYSSLLSFDLVRKAFKGLSTLSITDLMLPF